MSFMPLALEVHLAPLRESAKNIVGAPRGVKLKNILMKTLEESVSHFLTI